MPQMKLGHGQIIRYCGIVRGLAQCLPVGNHGILDEAFFTHDQGHVIQGFRSKA